jgi:hypothetical protein
MSLISRNISPDELLRLRRARWRGRTDILWLCNEVLGFPDVSREVHGPIVDLMQRFPLPPKERLASADRVEPGNLLYTPWSNPYVSLAGKRRMLLLDPRGGLKTSINCVAHIIQWILNFPHLAYLIVQANAKKAEDTLRDVKQIFQYNNTFRDIYPDYCPQRRVSDWGNRQEFDVPDEEGRNRMIARLKDLNLGSTGSRKEHTVMTSSIDKGTAGYHWDVMKFSDIVEENNTRTADQIQQVVYTFNMMENLLVKLDGWIDVEGTRYAYTDLYGKLIEDWEKSEKVRDAWKIHVRSCFLRDFGGRAPYYTPDSLKLEFLKDSNNKYISWWPSRFPLAALEAQKATDTYVFATQRLNDPVAGDDDTRPFPVKQIRWISKDDFARVPLSHFSTTVDTADTVGPRSNNSCITTCAWDRFGRCYVVDVKLSKMLPDALITAIFAAYARFKPARILVEETAYVRGLMPTIKRKMELSGIRPVFDFIKRENTASKLERIQNTVQPWFKAGEIIFLEDLEEHVKDHIIREFDRFGSWDDDFLDTLADQFQERQHFGRLVPRADNPLLKAHMLEQAKTAAMEKYLQVDPVDFGTGVKYNIPHIPANSTAWRTGV